MSAMLLQTVKQAGWMEALIMRVISRVYLCTGCGQVPLEGCIIVAIGHNECCRDCIELSGSSYHKHISAILTEHQCGTLCRPIHLTRGI
jgi:hypothetical protein